MDMEKIFSDLESNQPHECEESKKKLLDFCAQTKEHWLVHNMLDYFLITGSVRIMEVLVKVQAPHDIFLFDRLDDWLKGQQYRFQALNVFCFVVRRHPTWLYKIEKHRFIKSVFKLLLHEKEIVPLMGALLGIITLLPIIPNSVPNFLNDLFEVFGHLASWKLQNTNKLPDDKLVHLQLGLQMLFHRLYGMYPCNFLAYLGDFIKKDKGGGVFQHTIKPLLETVRVHPMLLTATTESEVINTRWKEMEPHDVVMECAHLSLPVVNQDFNNDYNAVAQPATPIGIFSSPSSNNIAPAFSMTSSNVDIYRQQIKTLQPTYGTIARFDIGDTNTTGIWSPHNEIATSSTIPLTPTPSYILPVAPPSSVQLLSLTGSSPPEAAVEATPETTPMKDIRESKHSGISGALANPHAVRALLVSSQPSSPMRNENSQFYFPEVNTGDDATSTTLRITLTEQEIGTFALPQNMSTSDRRVQQVMQDRTEYDALAGKREDMRATRYSSSTPEIEMEQKREFHFKALTSTTTPMQNLVGVTGEQTTSQQYAQQSPSTPMVARCDECNETDRNMCSAGGLHMPTSRSMQHLAKGIKRRNRMVSYCYNDSGASLSRKYGHTLGGSATGFAVRRTKSCSALTTLVSVSIKTDEGRRKAHNNGVSAVDKGLAELKPGGRLQKSGKMLSIASAKKQMLDFPDNVTIATQTLEIVPQHYENTLFEMISEAREQRNNYARTLLYPQDILDKYITQAIQSKENMDTSQFQLLCLQLHYERYRRGIHAERNRRLMGRSRDKRSLEMERDRLCEQLKKFDAANKSLVAEMDKTVKLTKRREYKYNEELLELKAKLQHEAEQNRNLQQCNEDLEKRLNAELTQKKEVNYELEALRGQIFSLNTELQHVQQQADKGVQYKNELERLEAEFIIMGEVQVRCRDQLAEASHLSARDEELRMLQESYNNELKELKHNLEDKTSHLDMTKHKIIELQSQLVNNEKVITEQKRLLKSVKDEYEEMFKALSKKYDVIKNIVTQMEEKTLMQQQKPMAPAGQTCSPDTDRTDIASSLERHSPLSTSLASSESLSVSLRSSELKNLQQIIETSPKPESSSINVTNYSDSRVTTVDLASSANTVNSIILMQSQERDIPTTSAVAANKMAVANQHFQQLQQDKHEQQ